MLSLKSTMDCSLILKIRTGEPFARADLDLFRAACFAFLDGGVAIEKSLRLTRLDHIEERNRYLIELGRLLSPHGQPRLRAMAVSKQISVFQRRKWKDNRNKIAPAPNFTEGECLLFWAHKIMAKMPSEKQLSNIFEVDLAKDSYLIDR